MADTPKMPSAEGPICAKCNLYADCRGKGCEHAHCPSCCPSGMASDTDRPFYLAIIRKRADEGYVGWDRADEVVPDLREVLRHVDDLTARLAAAEQERDAARAAFEVEQKVARKAESDHWKACERVAELTALAAAAERRAQEAEADRDRAHEGLRCAIQAAWDGPAEWVGTGCRETHRQWRQRMEETARSALPEARTTQTDTTENPRG